MASAQSRIARINERIQRTSRFSRIAGCLVLVALTGLVDYSLGYERSLLVGYLLPIALATWFVGRRFGLVTSLLSVTCWIVSDVAAGGKPAVGLWNAGMGLISYSVFVWLLSQWRMLLLELDERVRQRTAALRREITERKRLEREMAEVTERERRRLGQDLHDSICQHLTGTALVAHAVRERLEQRNSQEVQQAEKVVRLLEEGIDMTRNLARGFFSPDLEAGGLVVALRGLVESIRERSAIECSFDCTTPVRVSDATTATQLYRIAQEAVANATRHAQARRIAIELFLAPPLLTMTITDDGIGLPNPLPEGEGLGLRMMAHGAALIGGDLTVKRHGESGTIVTCAVQARAEDMTEEEAG